MTLDQLTPWAVHHPVLTATGAGTPLVLTVALAWAAVRAIRKSAQPASVRVAAVGAIVCTGYTADTSWRFATDYLGMTDFNERAVMFAAAEIALLACALMARANKAATATATEAGTTGVPGALVWVITGVQVIPAYAESGPVGGTVRAAIGPILAGLLWHLAMGLEIRISRPTALDSALLAQIGRELRERLLSRLGLAVRNRTAEQISRDRAMVRAVRLASRRRLSPLGAHRLAAAVTRSKAGSDGEQRHMLLQELAARRTAGELRTVPVTSPWVYSDVPEAYPATLLGVTGAQLRSMDPLEAVLLVQSAHPGLGPADLASLTTRYGVPVSETMVRIATKAPWPPPTPAPFPGVPAAPVLADVPDHVLGSGLVLDLAPMGCGPSVMASQVPVPASHPARAQVHAQLPYPPDLDDCCGEEGAAPEDSSAPRKDPGPEGVPEPVPGEPEAVPEPVPDVPENDDEHLLRRARIVDQAHRAAHSRPASIRLLKQELHIGQPKVETIRLALAREVEETAEKAVIARLAQTMGEPGK
ncbi:hypothetical protein [Streptomyces sp. NPDC050738]|uniref:hypothetical protein n=1 Tax=Streptomyces sp. NPDC050738 TaxID=3154744 RepID=UPI00341DA995